MKSVPAPDHLLHDVFRPGCEIAWPDLQVRGRAKPLRGDEGERAIGGEPRRNGARRPAELLDRGRLAGRRPVGRLCRVDVQLDG